MNVGYTPAPVTSIEILTLSMDTPRTKSLTVAPQAQAQAQAQAAYRHIMNSRVHTQLVELGLLTLALILKMNAKTGVQEGPNVELSISTVKINASGTIMETGRISCELVVLAFPSSVRLVVIQVQAPQEEPVELVSLIKHTNKSCKLSSTKNSIRPSKKLVNNEHFQNKLPSLY